MAKTFLHLGVWTLTSAGVIEANRFVTGGGALCGAGARAVGISAVEATGAGKPIGVCIAGVELVLLAGTVAAGDEVESDATGKAIKLNTGIPNGVAIDGGAAGELIQVLVR